MPFPPTTQKLDLTKNSKNFTFFLTKEAATRAANCLISNIKPLYKDGSTTKMCVTSKLKRSRSEKGHLLYNYCTDTEPLYHSFMYSLVSLFFPVSIHYLQCIHCLLHQMQEISFNTNPIFHFTFFS